MMQVHLAQQGVATPAAAGRLHRPSPNPSARPQVTFGLTCALLVFVAATYMFTRTRPVYLLNYHCFKPPAK